MIMIGEMRDAETIDTAMKAAETGHLLISTLHTPDAPETHQPYHRGVPAASAAAGASAAGERVEGASISQRLMPRANGMRAGPRRSRS